MSYSSELSSEAVPLSIEQFKALLDAIKTDRERAFVYLFGGHGLRLVEAIRLDIGDIYEGKVYLRGMEAAHWYPVLLEGREALLKLTNGRSGDEPAFVSNRRRRLSPEIARKNVIRLGARAGMKVTPHTLRLTFATLAYGAGCDKTSVSLLLRHKNKDVVDYYLHLSSEQRLQKIRVLLEKYSPLRLVKDE